MKKKQVKFLKQLVETASPTGFEEDVAELIRQQLSSVADEIQTDTMGSVHAILKGTTELADEKIQADILQRQAEATNFGEDYEYVSTYGASYGNITYPSSSDLEEMGFSKNGALTFMLSAHMDEVGLMVTYISDEGYCYVSSLGGVDAAVLPGMRVDVHTKDGILRGVVGRKPIHLIEADERKSVTPLDKLVIDLGLPADKVKRAVRIGDPITFGTNFERIGNNMAVSKSFDDKCGVYVACRVMERLSEQGRARATFVAAITVQEEIGTRGAITSAHSLNPDVAIAFDVTHATDYPGIDKTKYGNIVCGCGPVIARGPNINPLVFDRLVAAAEAEGIDYQLEAEPSVTGTDARSIQIAQGGIPTGLISIPLRYMHTPSEIIDLRDLEGAIKLITRFVMDLQDDSTFIPGITEMLEHPDADKVNVSRSSDSDQIKELKRKVKALSNKLAAITADDVASSSAKGDDLEDASEPSASNDVSDRDATLEQGGPQSSSDSALGAFSNYRSSFSKIEGDSSIIPRTLTPQPAGAAFEQPYATESIAQAIPASTGIIEQDIFDDTPEFNILPMISTDSNVDSTR